MYSKKVALFLIVFSFFAPLWVFSGGSPDIGLPKVDRLIKERNYNDALLELALYIQEHPEDFEGAQRRIKKIIELRKVYNENAEYLLNVLVKEPTNDKKKLDLITSMEALEKNPNSSTEQFIVDTKAAAQFTYNRAQFEEIFVQGNTLIDKHQYIEAAKKFTEGYVLYKDKFIETEKDEFVQEIDTCLVRIESAIQDLSTSLPVFIQEAVFFESVFSKALQSNLVPDAKTVQGAWLSLEKQFNELLIARNEIANEGWFFEETADFLAIQSGVITDNSFLPFAWRFTLGRKTSQRYEGVLGSIDSCIAYYFSLVDSVISQSYSKAWEESLGLLKEENTDQALLSIQNYVALTKTGNSFVETYNSMPYKKDFWGHQDYSDLVYSGQFVENISTLLYSYLNLIGQKKVLLGTAQAASIEEPKAALLRQNSNQYIGDRLLVIQKSNEILSAIQALSRSKIEEALLTNLSLQIAQDFNAWDQSIRIELSQLQQNLYDEIFVWYGLSSSLAVNEQIDGLRYPLSLLDGLSNEATATLLYYPAESIIALNTLKTNSLKDKIIFSTILSWTKTLAQNIIARPKAQETITAITSYITRLDRLEVDINAAITRANSRVLQANLAKQESDLRYSQAVTALRRNDFQTARDNLQRSREKANQSLGWQESISFRLDTDQKLEQLGIEITRLENESIVREVRLLITSGKNFYYQGNFDQAEQVFSQANARWSITNIEPNGEITTWLSIINTALSMKTGRSIPVSAPLFPQMSQLLSSANQLYNDGRDLIAQGNRTKAISLLTQAKEKLQQLKLVYPQNEEAGQLILKIDQVIDPQAFKTSFAQKITHIRTKYKTEPQTSYSDLLDLYKLDPNYPGIKKLLDEVEIYLGIQIPPPDPKTIARSTELTVQAQKIYDANTRSMFQVALDQLDEAIKINPNNQTAINLKDRVQTAIGGQSLAVLSAEDESKYQQAVSELQKGNKITASALVEQLLQNSKTKNSSKIQDLKRRIDSQL